MVGITKLEAVNSILSGIGQLPVNALDEISAYSEAADAMRVLDQISLDIQSQGLWFNFEENVPLAKDGNSEIPVPVNVISLSAADPTKDYVVRSGKVYDKIAHSYTFASAINANIIYHFDFEDLPHTLRRYITIAAARKFARDQLGSDVLNGMSEQSELDALLQVIKEDVVKSRYWITRASLEFQTRGWWFNTAADGTVSILPYDQLPSVVQVYLRIKATRQYHKDAIRVRISGQDKVIDLAELYTQEEEQAALVSVYKEEILKSTKGRDAVSQEFQARGWWFNTSFAGLDDPPGTEDYIESLEWDDLPPTVQKYIEIKASRQYHKELLNAIVVDMGDGKISLVELYSAQDEITALTEVYKEELLKSAKGRYQVCREVQSTGIWSSKEVRVKFTPDAQGNIVLPRNVLFADASDPSKDVVQLDGKLYDKLNRTFIFTDPIELDVIFERHFDDLPPVVQRYIEIRAYRQYTKDKVSDLTPEVYTKDDEQRALVNLKREQINRADINIIGFPRRDRMRRRMI